MAENFMQMGVMKQMSETLSYEVCIENLEDQIDLKTLVIHDGDQTYHVDFDAE